MVGLSLYCCFVNLGRILNAEGVLKQTHQEAAKRRKEKDWESNDFYDSDEDNFLDRTGQVERKRLKRMAQAGKLDDKTSKSMPGLFKNKTHTFDSLQADIKVLLTERYDIETKLEKCKSVFNALKDDDLDAYIESLKVGTMDTVTRAKLKRRLVECKMELVKMEKLLSVAKPKDFSIESWKQDIEAKLKDHLSLDVKPKPLIKQPETKEEVIEAVQPEKVSQVSQDKTSTVEKKVSEENEERTEPAKVSAAVGKRQQVKTETNEKSENSHAVKKPKKVEEKLEEYVDSKDYAVWLPPQGKESIFNCIF